MLLKVAMIMLYKRYRDGGYYRSHRLIFIFNMVKISHYGKFEKLKTAILGSWGYFMALAQLFHYTYWFWLVPVNFQNDEGCL